MHLEGDTFVYLAIASFGLVIGSFVVRGFGRLVVGSDTAQLLSMPVFVLGFLLAVTAFVLAVLVKVGIVDLAEPDEA